MKYEVNYIDSETGAESPIDTVWADPGYTAEDYLNECRENAEPEWTEMLEKGEVVLYPVEAVTRSWKVYGKNGHRLGETFNPSRYFDFSCGANIRIVEVFNSDRTGTNEYSIVRITMNTAEECERELWQMVDSICECCRVGEIEELEE